jgi:7-carboxy-7-deazaguanine synthase
VQPTTPPVAAVLTVNEVFFSIQGEGTRAGLPCVFVRLTGCPLRCTYCDTAYAFHEGRKRGEDDVIAEVEAYPCRLLLLTGGEPLAQAAAFPFVTKMIDRGWQVLVETSGHVPLDALDPRAVAIVDVKTPASGEGHRMHWANLDRLKPTDEVKFVIADRADYEWSRTLVRERKLADRCPVLFSPVHGVLDPGVLGRWLLEDGLPARLQVQLHKYLWPGVERGV